MGILGLLLCAVAVGIIIIMIASGIEMALRDAEEERVRELAERRFREMLGHVEFHVIQRLVIKDEMH